MVATGHQWQAEGASSGFQQEESAHRAESKDSAIAAVATAKAVKEAQIFEATTVSAVGQSASVKQCCQGQALSAAGVRAAVGVAVTVRATHVDRTQTQSNPARTRQAAHGGEIGRTCVNAAQGMARMVAGAAWLGAKGACVWTATCPQKTDSEMGAPATVTGVKHS